MYSGKKFSDDTTLASILVKEAKGGDVKLAGKTKIGNIEKAY